jgi:hypothetical protein
MDLSTYTNEAILPKVFAHILPTVGVIEACFSLIFIGYGWAVKYVKTLERLGIFGFRWLQLKKMNKRKHLSLFYVGRVLIFCLKVLVKNRRVVSRTRRMFSSDLKRICL